MLKVIKQMMVWLSAGFLLLGPAFSSYSAHLCLQEAAAVSTSVDDCCNTSEDCCGEVPIQSAIQPYPSESQCCVEVSAYFNFPVFSEKQNDQVNAFPFQVCLFSPSAFRPFDSSLISSFGEENLQPPDYVIRISNRLSFTGVFRV
jgi:hypothetical protein